MRVGLLLGGGGTVGIAWEHGVLAGLQDAIGFEARSAAVIVGTSAGSSVGADLALGKDPHHALDEARETTRELGRIGMPDREKGPFAEILKLMLSPDARTPEGVARIGRLAIGTETAFTAEQFVERFRRTLGTDEWPAVDLRVTAACASTGEPQTWTAADGIGLSRAVASSCAIPGFFPTIPFEGRHYFDGSRGRDYHTRVVADLDLDAALFVGPKIAVPGVEKLIRDDMAALEKTGVRVHTMMGSLRLDALGPNLMDSSLRPTAFEAGKQDAADQADAIAERIGGVK